MVRPPSHSESQVKQFKPRMCALSRRVVIACVYLLSCGLGAYGQPITLELAIREAMENNLNILAERYNVSIAEAQIMQARLRPNPILTVDSDHLPFAGTRYNLINGAGPAEFSIRTDVLMERGGKRRARIAQAELARSVAELQLANSMRQLVFDVQSAFVDVLLAKENLAVSRRSLVALEGITKVNLVRVNSGDLAKVELVRSQVAALQFRNEVRQSELRVRTALNRLQLLLGRTTPSPHFDVVGTLQRGRTIVLLDDLRRQALDFRPDLTALRRDHARSQYAIRREIAEGKVDYLWGSEFRRQQGLAGTGNSIGLFFSAPLPLFNKNQGEILRAQREQRQLELRIRAMQAEINNEVENAYQQYAMAQNLLDSIETDMLSQASDVQRIMEYSYRRGEATLIEFLDAQRAYFETEQGYNEAMAEYTRTLFLLDSVAGKVGIP